jgi:hypothetical protein
VSGAPRAGAWSPERGPAAAPQQRVPPPPRVDARGRVVRGPGALWTASEGPCRPETGGAGGEPDGTTIPIRKDCWD